MRNGIFLTSAVLAAAIAARAQIPSRHYHADPAAQDNDSNLYEPSAIPPMAPGDDSGPAGIQQGRAETDATPTPASTAPDSNGTFGGGSGGAARSPNSSGTSDDGSGGTGGNDQSPANPSSSPNTLPSGNTPLPSGYGAPIKRFTGRFLDALNIPDYQCNFRTARAREIKISTDKKRIYIAMGSGVVAYDAATFFTSKLGQPLVSINYLAIPLGFQSIRVCGHFAENYLPWDQFSYFESPKSGFRYMDSRADGQERLAGYDIDDRGNVYSATYIYGWGIAHDDGGVGTTLMSFVSQVDSYNPELKDVNPASIFAVKANGRYYALVGVQRGRVTGVWDVTNAAKPVFLGVRNIPLPDTIARNRGGDRLAMVDYAATSGDLTIYTAQGYVNGAPPIFRASPEAGRSFGWGAATDGTNFYAAEAEMPTGGAWTPKRPLRFHTLTPNGQAFTDTPAETTELCTSGRVDYGGGFLSVTGYYGHDIRLFRAVSPTKIQNVGGDFLHGYYSKTGDPRVAIAGTLPYVHSNGKTYLIVSAGDLGDVYQLNVGAATSAPSDPAPVDPAGPVATTPDPSSPPVPPAKTACSTVPTQDHISMFYNGAESKCARFSVCTPGESINFFVSGGFVGFPFDEACDKFIWNWDDGKGSVPGPRNPVHVFGRDKSSYKVSMTMTSGGGSLTMSTVVDLLPSASGPGPTEPPSPGAKCGAAPNQMNVSVLFTGESSQCSRFAACTPGEPVDFFVRGGVMAYPFNKACDKYTWDWDDGRGPVAGGKDEVHTFGKVKNTYNVAMTISGGGPSLTLHTIVNLAAAATAAAAAHSGQASMTSQRVGGKASADAASPSAPAQPGAGARKTTTTATPRARAKTPTELFVRPGASPGDASADGDSEETTTQTGRRRRRFQPLTPSGIIVPGKAPAPKLPANVVAMQKLAVKIAALNESLKSNTLTPAQRAQKNADLDQASAQLLELTAEPATAPKTKIKNPPLPAEEAVVDPVGTSDGK
jgi:hypothetical protein